MYRAVWCDFPGGATIDRDPAKARSAALSRPDWSCYQGDTSKALLAGWMGHVPWDVVDLDAYGEPWPFVRAWLLSERRRASETTLFLTDGYRSQASLAGPSKTIFPGTAARMNVSPSLYAETVAVRMGEWCEKARLEIVEWGSIEDRRMDLSIIRLRQKSLGARIPADGATSNQTAGIS